MCSRFEVKMSVPAQHGSRPRRIAKALVIASLTPVALIGSTSLAQSGSIFSGQSGLPTSPVTGEATSGAKPKVKRVERPKLGSFEYRLSWGLQSIEADRAYARGITGAGVTVAMIDTGVASQRMNGLGHLSPLSTDLIPDRKPPATVDPHGLQVASVIAAPLDNNGTVGVAYQSTIMSIRADIDGSCARQCAVYGKDLARGIDYAVAHGARIIGVPLVGPNSLPTVEAALGRAVAAGAVIVMAAGNDGGKDPLWPARYAADPRFNHALIVAGAAARSGRLADWSNRAGVAADRYVSAPGDSIITDCDAKYCWLVSGSSYSVAYVVGSLALMLESQPNLAPQEAANILLRTAEWSRADHYGDGHGLVDVGHALKVIRQKQASAS
jgi:subtilisin family serine protease